jgi:Transcriptional regulator
MLTLTRRENRKFQTAKLLRNAMVELILDDNNIREITVSEIASRADLNRGTFYIHYKEKEELTEDLFAEAIEGIRHALRVPYENIDKVILEGVVPSTRLIFEHIENHKSLFQALDLVQATPNLYDRLEEEMRKITIEEIRFQMEKGAAEIEYDIFASYQVHATLGVIKHWIRSRFKYSADYMSEQLTAIYSQRITAMIINRGN